MVSFGSSSSALFTHPLRRRVWINCAALFFFATQVQKPLMSVKLFHHVIALLILFILWRLQRKVKN